MASREIRLSSVITSSSYDPSRPARPADQPHQRMQRVEVPVDDALLQGDDRVVGDGDVLGADLGAALGDVAVADPHRLLDLAGTIDGVEGMHLERRGVDEVARAGEGLVKVVVAQDVADVLAEEALD